MNKRFLFAFTILCSANLWADLPLSLEELYTDKGKFKLEANLTYANSEQQNNSVSQPVYIETTNHSLVAIPTVFSQTNSNNDMLLGNLGLRYGLTGKTDIYGNLSYLWNSERNFDGLNSEKSNQNYLSDATIGLSHTFWEDGNNPALIGFIEGQAYDRVLNKSSSAKSWVIGATTYKAIDPVVLSLTASLGANFKRKTAMGDYKAGNYFMLNPSVSFAANDRVSFTGGVQWINSLPERLNDSKLSSRNTSTYAKFGIGFGVNDKTAINASARFKLSGNSRAELNLGLVYSF
ncbi:MAG: meta-pathway of phenol degradation family protein [Neisseriaceae bacterium]|nr:meta-pathway of phenol degradation family protein [Neisseriaceae bacterium]